jgi:hypothetical protein
MSAPLQPRLALSLAFGLLLACGQNLAAHAAVSFTTVALTDKDGRFGPGLGPGVEFTILGEPVINEVGETAFDANLSSGQMGIWKSADGGNIPIALSGTEGPLGPPAEPGMRFLRFLGVELNDRGEVASSTSLIGGPGSEATDAILLHSSGTNHLVARARTSGPLGPNLGDDGVFPSLGSTVILSNTSEVMFSADVSFSRFRGGIWTAELSGPQPRIMLFDDGQYGPRMGPGIVFAGLTFPYFNANGKMLFGAQISPGAPNESGLWTLEDTDLRLIATEGDAGALGPQIPGATFVDNFASYDINAAGEIIFENRISTGTQGLWRHRASGNVAIALGRTDGPLGPQLGPGIGFNDFLGTAVNEEGELAFGASFNPESNLGDIEFGIFETDNGSIHPIALRRRDDALGPQLGPGVFFSRLGFPLLNNADQIVFEGGLTGAGVNSTNDEAIWAFLDDQLALVVRKGDSIDVDPTSAIDLRAISDLHFIGAHSPLSEGRNSYFNDAGQFAFRADFSDGTSGIFIATIPEPRAAELVAVSTGIVVLSLTAARRRHGLRSRA